MNNDTNHLFELLQIALGHKAEFSHIPSEKAWRELYILAKKQALLGITFAGIEHLPKMQRPPKPLLMQWILATEHIRNRNIELNSKTLVISNRFLSEGFRNVILKGQGVAKYYGELAGYRTSGDVDIWLDGKRRDIIAYVRRHDPDCKVVYHHVDFPKIDGVDVEVHFTPSYMANPFANRRLHKWIQNESIKQFEHCTNIGEGITIHTPTLAFNRVFILHHIYRHFFYEGIGLRQMMDFYYVLKQGFTKEEQEETQCIYKKLNLLNFAGAAVYVLREIFGLEEMFYIVAPNEKYGKILLSEILSGGNFGQVKQQRNTKENKLQRGWRIIKRSLQFIMYEPLEVVWLPYFKVMNNLLYVRCISK